MGTQPTNEKLSSAEDKESLDGIPAPSGDANLIDTDYVVGQDNIKGRISIDLDLHGKVFIISAVVCLLFVILTLALQTEVEPLFIGVRDWITSRADWLFISAVDLFILICVGLILSPLGRVRIGGVDAKPDYPFLTWFSMLFAAGMGIGLMFYGVAEPITHFESSFNGITVGDDGVRTDWAPLHGAEGNFDAAKSLGMAATLHHWALHGWAIFGLIGLALAIFTFNKGLPMSVRSIFYPILGERVWGWPGHIIDILAVFATLFGLVTSLGFGASQAASGLHYLFDIEANNTVKVLLVVVITAIALYSVVSGMEKGVRRLSEINIFAAFLLMVFVFLVGPTLLLSKDIFNNLVSYFAFMPELSKPFSREDVNFSQGWSTFYWAWWISWSPFVGMFIARISRGRTVREFLLTVLLAPSIVCLLWFSIFGGTGLELAKAGFTEVVDAELSLKLFMLYEHLPLTRIISFFSILLVCLFFITSADTGSLIIDTITSGGKVNAPVVQRVFWTIISGLIAIALLLGGGLGALQAGAVSTGLPFTVVLLLASFCTVKGLMSEPRRRKA